jgi:hypothetical protein
MPEHQAGVLDEVMGVDVHVAPADQPHVHAAVLHE